MSRRPIIALERVTKTYASGAAATQALRGVSLKIERGGFVAIMGASGSGKSTLMNIVGALDVPTSGRYLLDGIDVSTLDDNELATVRNRTLGFVFQGFNLIAGLGALENVELPLIYARAPGAERRRRALAALEAVGLGDRGHHLPAQLSGGQQQRVAVARAIVTEPGIVLADEPTGNLDSASTEELLQILAGLNDQGRTIVLITHEDDIGERAKRTIRLQDGRIVDDRRNADETDSEPSPPPRVTQASGARG